MIEIYVKLIINKRKDFTQVPSNLQHDVMTRLKELGYDTNGDVVGLEE